MMQKTKKTLALLPLQQTHGSSYSSSELGAFLSVTHSTQKNIFWTKKVVDLVCFIPQLKGLKTKLTGMGHIMCWSKSRKIVAYYTFSICWIKSWFWTGPAQQIRAWRSRDYDVISTSSVCGVALTAKTRGRQQFLTAGLMSNALNMYKL